MSRVTNTVSKLSRTIGTSAINRAALESHDLAAPYAELLRSHRRNQWDNQHHPASKPFTTKKQVPEPTTNPIVLPTPRPVSAEERHTPIPIISRPEKVPARPPPETVERGAAPQVVYVAGENPNNPLPSLENLDKIDVDEARLMA